MVLKNIVSKIPASTVICDAVIANLPSVQEKVSAFLENTVCRPGTMMHIEMILEELYVNVASYAYPGTTGEIQIEMVLDKDPDAVRITLRDKGIPYNPLENREPDLSLNANERSVGGLGIYLSRKFADSITYKRENDENILTFTKNLP
jgi:anti-sigma regulatory factor (Ser/Thr protein kinase)